MNKLFKNGLFYSAIGRYGNFFITLLVNVILSRMLTPAQYGQVTALQVFITFFQLMSSAGIGIAIVQRKNLTKEDIESIYSYSVLLSIFLAAVFPLIGIIVDYFYQSNIYFNLSLAFSVAVLFYGLVVVPNAVLMKNLNFKVINIVQIITILLGACVGIISAYYGFGAYSLVLMTVTSTGLDFLCKAYLSHLKLGRLRLESLKKVLDFSVNIFISDFLKYFSQNMDNFLVGKFYGASALGNYGKAYQLLRYPNYLISGIFVSVLGPVLASKKEDINYLKEFYLKILNVLSYIGFALSAFFMVNAQSLINFLFGNQWIDAVMPFKLLSISVWVQVLFGIIGPMFEVRDTTHYWRKLTQFNTLIMVSSIVIGIMWGSLEMLALFVTFGFIVTYFIANRYLSKYVFNVNQISILKWLIKPFVLFLINLIALQTFRTVVINTISSDFMYLIISGVIMLCLDMIFIFIFGDLKNILSVFRKGD